MVDQNMLKTIIEQVLTEMNLGNAAPVRSPAAAEVADAVKNSDGLTTESVVKVDDGFIPDVSAIDIRKQYLVENPLNRDAYYDLKQYAPARLGIGTAGAPTKPLPVIVFRAAHAGAQDAVFSPMDLEFVEKLNLFVVRTMCTSKDEYLTRPDLGRKLTPEGVAMIKEKCKKNPTVQIFVSDGLSSAAVVANIPDLLPALMQGLQSYGIDVGTPFFVEYGRVGVEDEITEITGATVTCDLVGERPGLITAESMSAYITYKGTVGMPEARRTVISNIHKDGTPPVEAGAHIAEVIKIMLEKKASGTDLKL